MTGNKFKIGQTVYLSIYSMGEIYPTDSEITDIKHDGTDFKYYLDTMPHCFFDESEIFASKEELIRDEIANLNLQIVKLGMDLIKNKKEH